MVINWTGNFFHFFKANRIMIPACLIRMNMRPKLGMTIVFFRIIGILNANAQESFTISLNQLGYYPEGPKVAVISANVSQSRFYVIRFNTKDTVYRGRLSALRSSLNSSIQTQLADFSTLKDTGKYFISVPGISPSFPFEIRSSLLRSIGLGALKAFYFMRSNEMLPPDFAGKWSRAAGHPDTQVIIHPSAASEAHPAGSYISTPGGWYDAGDYNKYIVNSGITMGTLLSAYEEFPGYYDALQINIPESRDKVPDLLNEVLYNLRWMLTMQDPSDGGVYHKCTNAEFDGMVMPGVTKLPRYVVQKSTAASLDFAAVMAQAARVFKKFEKQLPYLSDSCLKSALKAWEWSVKNPSIYYNQNQLNADFDPDINTGAYGDNRLQDEWLWSAAELYVTTGNRNFLLKLQERRSDAFALSSWSNVGMMGYYTLSRNRKSLSKAEDLVNEFEKRILRMADSFALSRDRNAFATVMGQSRSDYVWGSNAVAANQGILLIQAYRITGNKTYLEAALSNVDYLLGRNATGYCFITGYGTRSPMHPHHRPSEADGIPEPVPGLLVGGPNPGRQDKCNYHFLEPETCYLDEVCSYASNEIAINWNAPVVYLLNAIEGIME